MNLYHAEIYFVEKRASRLEGDIEHKNVQLKKLICLFSMVLKGVFI
jgi:hypothetical protein